MNDNMIVPLPSDVTGLLGGLVDGDGYLSGVHPGLTLDKYALSWDKTGITKGLSERVQRPAVDQVVRLSHAAPPGLDYATLFARWEATLGAKEHGFTGTTAGPLTLHLARASALENAGICLHRIYGFTFLPGSGLKGLARAFAETVWLDSKDDKRKAWEDIEAVFGWAPGSNKDKPYLPDGAEEYRKAKPASVGSVIFHDAWPEKWPRLVTDILNSHHPKYYSEGKPPGDWEDPVPVYFLSVEPKTKFRFVVAKRRDDVSDDTVKQATAWLIGGLTQLGAGAKTASGYGDFTVEGHDAKPADTDQRKSFTATLELVTPAFLAGAKQQREDCDLRPATLRGQLRWWWRTMHAGFVTVEQLRAMEAAIWGDTKTGGAVRVTVSPNGPVQTFEYDRKAIIMQQRLPQPPDRKTSQGLIYHSYGMDDGGKPRRFFVSPGTSWTVTVAARGPLAAEKLAQAKAALILLCQYGGVGAKARKGFGSFADQPGGVNLIGLKAEAAGFRTKLLETLHLPAPQAKFNPRLAESPSLEQLLTIPEVPSGGANPWLALDQLAASAQQFAKKYKHRAEKKALGLPRKIGAPASGMFRPGPHILRDKERHASPGLYHFARTSDGNLVARAVAFPAAELPNLADSTTFLKELLDHIAGDLPPRFQQHVAGRGGPAAHRAPTGPPRPTGPALAPNQRVRAKIVDDPKGKKGRVFAEVQGLVGNILNAPANRTLTAGDEVDLLVNSVNVATKQIAFRWPA